MVDNRCGPRVRLYGRRSPLRACQECRAPSGKECPNGVPRERHMCLHDVTRSVDGGRTRTCRRTTQTTTGMLRHERDYHGASSGVTARQLVRRPYTVFVQGVEVSQ